MMIKFAFKICLIIIVSNALLTPNSYGQESSTEQQSTVQITMSNGNIYEGEIISDDGREILIADKNIGNIYLKKIDIVSILKSGEANVEIKNNELDQFKHSKSAGYSTRYQLSSNALPMEKGNHFSAVNIYGPELHFVPKDNLMINIATTWLASPFTLAIKYTLPLNQEFVHIGIGSRAWTTAYFNKFRGYGFSHWLTATFGNHTDNFSIGFGYGYTDFGRKAEEVEDVGEYIGEQYFQEYGVGTQNIPRSFQTPDMSTTFYISIGGRKSINKKISFTVDGTFAVGNKPTNYRRITTSKYGTERKATVEAVEELLSVGYFMPGIRIELSKDRAFQFSVFSYYINKEFSLLGSGIPLPMLTWFRNF